MKKTLLNSLKALMLACVVLLQSCGDDESTTGPILVVTSISTGWDGSNNSFSGEAGDMLELALTVTAENGFNMISINDGGVEDLWSASADEEGETEYSGTYTYELMGANAGDSVVLTIIATDDESNTTEEMVTVHVTENAVSVTKYTAKLLYAPTGDNKSETFFSTDDGTTYSRENVEGNSLSSKIDFGYYYGANDNASIASPEAYPIGDLEWDVENKTMMKLTDMPEEHFDGITNNSHFANHWGMTDMADADGDVVGLSEGDLIAFTLDDSRGNKKGFLLVKTISGTWNEGDYIEVEVIMEGEE